MAADQDRAERIKKLKRERPDLKWRVIADRVGVTERAAAAWAQNGGIAYENAKKLAEIFEVDVDYIMRGNASAPDLFGQRDDDQLDRIEAKLDALKVHLEVLMNALELERPDLLVAALDVTPRSEDDAPARVVGMVWDAAAKTADRRESAAPKSRTRR